MGTSVGGSLFNSGLFGGNAGGDTPIMGTPLRQVLYLALRQAGVTKNALRTPGAPQFADAMALLNVWLGRLNTLRSNIFTISINQYTLQPGKLSYTIGGPGFGADFDRPRPIKIQTAVIWLDGTTRTPPMYLMTSPEWEAIQLQTFPNDIPRALYCDYNSPLATIYTWGQVATTTQMELATWSGLQKFQSLDDLVTWPDGYEDAIVYNLGIKLAQFWKLPIDMDMRREANESLGAIQARNSPVLKMVSDAANLSSRRGGQLNWRTGLIG